MNLSMLSIESIEQLTQTNFPTYRNFILLEVSQVRETVFTFAYSQQGGLKLPAVNCYEIMIRP